MPFVTGNQSTSSSPGSLVSFWNETVAALVPISPPSSGVTLTASLASPLPIELTARIRNQYSVPLASGLTVKLSSSSPPGALSSMSDQSASALDAGVDLDWTAADVSHCSPLTGVVTATTAQSRWSPGGPSAD